MTCAVHTGVFGGSSFAKSWPGSPPQHLNQVPNLFIHFLGAADGGGDFTAQQVAMAQAKPMGGGLDGGFGQPEPRSDLRITAPSALARLEVLQLIEQFLLAIRLVLLPQSRHSALHESLRPAPLIDLVGRPLIRRLEGVTFRLLQFIQGEDDLSTAALLGAGLVALVRKVVLEKFQEEGTKLPLSMAQVAQKVLLKKMDEESLGQVLGIRRGMSLAAQVGVDGRPIGLAKPGQTLAGLRG